MPLPTAVPPSASWASRSRVDSLPGLLNLRRPAANLLAKADRHRVHKVRPAGLDNIVRFLGPAAEHELEMVQRGNQRFVDEQIGRDVDRRRNHVVAALAHVDVVVGMDRPIQYGNLGSAAGDHLVRVHVG
jgi:hypothetical protein